MQSLAECDAWVTRVLEVGLPARPAASGGGDNSQAPTAPFQIFVKSVDNVTLTLRLPRGPATTLGELRDLVEARSGLSLGEHFLMIGTKPFRGDHADLAVTEYDVRPDQTLFLQGALKGGFGERAAIADVILRDIDRGNVLGDMQATDGRSGVKVGFGRQMLDPTTSLGQAFEGKLFRRLDQQGILPQGVASPQDLTKWLGANSIFALAAVSSSLQAGNCDEYAACVATALVSQTENQTVYRASMTNGYHHAFVITSPTDHGTDIEALYNDPDAMVADGWMNNTICTFQQFADGTNPYKQPMDRKNLSVRVKTAATGQPPLSEAVQTAIQDVTDELQAANTRKLEENFAGAKAKLRPITACAASVKNGEWQVTDLEMALANLADGGAAEQEVREAEKLVETAKADLVLARQQLQIAREQLSNTFGEPGELWDKSITNDFRSTADLIRTFDRAFDLGGIVQLEVAMANVIAEEFFAYARRNPPTMIRVLGSDKLGGDFQRHCWSLDDDAFWKVCLAVEDDAFEKYISDDKDLYRRFSEIEEMKHPRVI